MWIMLFRFRCALRYEMDVAMELSSLAACHIYATYFGEQE